MADTGVMNRSHAATAPDVRPVRETLTGPLVKVTYPAEIPGELSDSEVELLLEHRPMVRAPAPALERRSSQPTRSPRGILWGFALSLAAWTALAWALGVL